MCSQKKAGYYHYYRRRLEATGTQSPSKTIRFFPVPRQARQLRLRFGPKHTMEASVAELFRRGGRMSSNGLKLQQPIDATRLTPEELKKREETWLAKPWDMCFFCFCFFG